MLALVAILWFAAGPGGPFCVEALATPTHGPMTAMAGCDQPAPTKKMATPAHHLCVAACAGVDCAPPQLAPRLFGSGPLTGPDIHPLKGVHTDPDPEPPRR